MGKFFKGKARKKRTPAYSILAVSVPNGEVWADFFYDDEDIRGCYLTIKDSHGAFEHIITGPTYGYLLTAVVKKNEDEVKNYVYMMWRISNEIYDDPEFYGDIVRALNNRDERLLAKGAENAAKTTEEEASAKAGSSKKEEPDEGSSD